MEDQINVPVSPYILDAYDAVNEYITQQRALRAVSNYGNQHNRNIDEAIAWFMDVAIESEYAYLDNPAQQNNLPEPNHPTPPFLREEADQFLCSLRRIDPNVLAKDDKLCEICFSCFDEWRWGDEHPENAGVLKPFMVLEGMMPETPVRLPCGHIFGELCLRTWMMGLREGPPTCPKCRVVLKKVGEVKRPDNGLRTPTYGGRWFLGWPGESTGHGFDDQYIRFVEVNEFLWWPAESAGQGVMDH